MGVQEDEQMLSDAYGAIAEGTWPEPKGGSCPPWRIAGALIAL